MHVLCSQTRRGRPLHMTAAGNHFPTASDYSEQSMCREGTETLAERKRGGAEKATLLGVMMGASVPKSSPRL